MTSWGTHDSRAQDPLDNNFIVLVKGFVKTSIFFKSTCFKETCDKIAYATQKSHTFCSSYLCFSAWSPYCDWFVKDKGPFTTVKGRERIPLVPRVPETTTYHKTSEKTTTLWQNSQLRLQIPGKYQTVKTKCRKQLALRKALKCLIIVLDVAYSRIAKPTCLRIPNSFRH